MKKIMKSRIFLIVILCIIRCSIGVYAATTYKATDVVYNASDGTNMNVNDALNDLYNKSNNNSNNLKIYEVNFNSGGGHDCHIIFDISETQYSKIVFESRPGGGDNAQPYIYFSNDLTNWTKEKISKGTKYEYVKNEFSFPTGTIYLKLEWPTNSDRAWFHNIQFE